METVYSVEKEWRGGRGTVYRGEGDGFEKAEIGKGWIGKGDIG